MTLIYQNQAWAAQAACANVDPDSLFVRGSAQRQARQVCFSCPVRIECLADALESKMAFGVWGGLTERERRAILRRYPNESRWYERLRTSDEPLQASCVLGVCRGFRPDHY
ncbi:WhiB family transcriptional regulator [Arcanobacterium hippocoleae]|uniref:WhiB family transcriptional regulator n=1 Tax=Arcanobacterium hippocoleae TaxID=149017 RepID=UPI00334029A1